MEQIIVGDFIEIITAGGGKIPAIAAFSWKFDSNYRFTNIETIEPRSLPFNAIYVLSPLIGENGTIYSAHVYYDARGVQVTKQVNYYEGQKQKKKEFEITSFCKNDNHYVLTIWDGDMSVKNIWEDNMFHAGKIIRSIQRLSDGEIFTLGDEVKRTDGLKGKIVSINRNGGIFTKRSSAIEWNLSNIEKAKKPQTFKTEDGYEVEGKDYGWGVHKSCVSEPFRTTMFSVAPFNGTSTYKYFKLESNAWTWYDNNKRCLSVEEVMCTYHEVLNESLDGSDSSIFDIMKRKLANIAESR